MIYWLQIPLLGVRYISILIDFDDYIGFSNHLSYSFKQRRNPQVLKASPVSFSCLDFLSTGVFTTLIRGRHGMRKCLEFSKHYQCPKQDTTHHRRSCLGHKVIIRIQRTNSSRRYPRFLVMQTHARADTSRVLWVNSRSVLFCVVVQIFLSRPTTRIKWTASVAGTTEPNRSFSSVK